MSQLPEQKPSLPSHSRDAYWDVVKALLILLVIWGHTIQVIQYLNDGRTAAYWNSPFFKGIYLFHMPLFMGISGYFAAASIGKRGKEALKRYGVRLITPCITFALIHKGMEVVLSHHSVAIAILWFLIVLFENVCLYYVFRHYTGLMPRVLLLLIPPFLIAALSPIIPSPLFPFLCTKQFTFLWPIFLLGAMLYEKGYTSSRISKRLSLLMPLIIPVSILVPSAIFVYNTPLALSASAMMYDAGRTLIAIVFCGAFLGMVQCITSLGRFNLIQQIGRATLALYVLQSIFFSGANAFLGRHGVNRLPDIFIFVLALVLLLLLYGLYVLLRRLPLVPFLLFGEKKL